MVVGRLFARARPPPRNPRRTRDRRSPSCSRSTRVLHLLDRAGFKLAELERAERHADQPGDGETEMAEHIAHLAVLALADREREPDVGALRAIERRLDRPVADAVDGDRRAQRIERGLVTAPWARTR